MKKLVLISLIGMLLIAGCGPLEIKMNPKYKPANQDVYVLIANDTYRQMVTINGSIFTLMVKKKRLMKVMDTANAKALFVKAVNDQISSEMLNYKVLTNVQVGTNNCPLLKKEDKLAVDRDFSKIKSTLTSDLVLEFRFDKFNITQKGRGAGGDYLAEAVITGILVDVKSNKKVWQKTESFKVELDGMNLADMIKDDAKLTKKHFYDSIATTLRKLIKTGMIPEIKKL